MVPTIDPFHLEAILYLRAREAILRLCRLTVVTPAT